MNDQSSEITTDTATAPAATVSGGGGTATAPQKSPQARAAEHLQLLPAEAREKVLDSMDPTLAQQVRDQLASMADRPHGDFAADVAERRRMLREMENRIYAAKVAAGDQATDGLHHAAATPVPMYGAAPSQPHNGAAPMTPPTPQEPLDMLKTLHPAAIARAMQGERAEAWSIVLDRLDTNARAALQLYLDGSARMAIEDARSRQADLAATSPALFATIEAAIARTVVPRAMREHHQLLSTTPLQWTGTGPSGAFA